MHLLAITHLIIKNVAAKTIELYNSVMKSKEMWNAI